MHCTGVVSQVRLEDLSGMNHTEFLSRCLASPGNIDDPTQQITPRTTEHTVQVSHDSELLHAWDTFGIISDIIVCFSSWFNILFIINNTSLYSSLLQSSFPVPISMSRSCLIFYTSSWRESSRITWWRGLESTLNRSTGQEMRRSRWITLTAGKSNVNCSFRCPY